MKIIIVIYLVQKIPLPLQDPRLAIGKADAGCGLQNKLVRATFAHLLYEPWDSPA